MSVIDVRLPKKTFLFKIIKNSKDQGLETKNDDIKEKEGISHEIKCIDSSLISLGCMVISLLNFFKLFYAQFKFI